MTGKNEREKYVLEYYENQFHKHGINLHDEIKIVGKFLLENVKGKTLDFGCGPALHFWGFFMESATTLDGIDITPENVEFLNSYIKTIDLEQYKGVQKCMRELLDNPSFELSDQLRKIRKISIQDFTKSMNGIDRDYDTIVAPFSIGCVKNLEEYTNAIQNMSEHLKSGGKAIFLGTTGASSSDVIPDYCYQGVRNNPKTLGDIFKQYFTHVSISEIELEKEETDMFDYSALILLTAIKK